MVHVVCQEGGSDPQPSTASTFSGQDRRWVEAYVSHNGNECHKEHTILK